MFKIIKKITAIIASLMCFGYLGVFAYLITIEDSIGNIIFLSVLALFCSRILYLLIRDDIFSKTEYIEVVKKIPTDENYKKSFNMKHLYSAKCVINGKVKMMYFKSKDDYFKVSENKEYIAKRVGNKILEVE